MRGFRIYDLGFVIIPFVVCGSDARIKDLGFVIIDLFRVLFRLDVWCSALLPMLVKTTMKFNILKCFNGFKLLNHTKIIKPLKHLFMAPVCDRCLPEPSLLHRSIKLFVAHRFNGGLFQ
jgi:hypothetical protein